MSLFPEMSEAIKFFVTGEPIAQPRQRHAYRNGIVMSYIPQDHPIWAFKQAVQLMAKLAYNGKPLEGPLRVSLLFLMPRPGRLIWKTRPMPRVWQPAKPDADNMAKAVMDSLNKHLWADDAQIVDLHAVKMYASSDESPGVEVMVQELV